MAWPINLYGNVVATSVFDGEVNAELLVLCEAFELDRNLEWSEVK